ncbi:glutathione S-transferase family protein [Roseococcus sp. SYP-B2431]|uniref:glutathione S-transferase family protein n=1 Tax=Roseococcus sp. SYP-B2431 TaxID=2496640 RepID=UPI00103EC3E0|nr:glutathione S-transferase family protein [Roseococcus sp. SYP-B2431]TCH97548.1 glutathione S-transferase family protein [Roseococcus sp. SYP-B2431]
MTERKLFELCGTDPDLRFSPYCWRIRMALAHKGLDAETIPWRFTQTEAIAFAGSKTVPVLIDGDHAVADSWAIAEYLDRTYPDRPALFPGPPAALRFAASWADRVLNAGLAKLIVSDIPSLLGAGERAYFVESRERRFGMPLDQVTAGREAKLPEFRASLQPLRAVLMQQPCVAGDAPDYADYLMFGGFMWARVASPLRILEESDPVHAWMERMLDLFGGLARGVPARAGD